MTGSSTQGIKTVLHPVSDLATAAGWTDASAGRAAWPGPKGSTGRSEAEPDVLLEVGQIEPGDADADREGGPA
jgi:hypothetical protein